MIERNWRDLIKPRGMDIDRDEAIANFGKFVAKPLERGFGLTLGNSLRRVLLSSIQGAAITALRFEGVQHEFASLTDVTEDVSEIILNLKEVRFKLFAPKVTVAIDKVGPAVVRASDIIAPEQAKVLNPDLVIATLGKGARLQGELLVQMGRGYRSAENNKTEDLPMGWIAVDSFFSPIRKVNYTVTQSRVGQRTDYDKLTLEVWTDGSVSAEDAVSFGAKILKDQLSVFTSLEDEPEAVTEEKKEIAPSFNSNLLRSVDELELSVRSANCLQNANIKYIWQLVQKTEAEMLKTKNFGRKSLNEIKEILSEMGLSLGLKLDGFVPPSNPPAPVGGDSGDSMNGEDSDDSAELSDEDLED